MRPWVGGVLVIGMAATGACHAPRPHAPESAFGTFRHAAVSAEAALPAGELRLTAHVLQVGPTGDGTYLVLAEPTRDDEPLILVYGSPVDSIFGKYLQGQQMDIAFKVVGRTTLPDGRSAVRVSISGMQVVAMRTPAATTP